MQASPGGTQIGGNVAVNIDRRRVLSQATARRLIENLRQLTERPVAITTNYGDVEAQRLAQQLTAVFLEAGWLHILQGQAQIAPGPLPGIQIRSRSPIPQEFTKALEPLFEQFGQRPVVEMDQQVNPEAIQLFLGLRE